MVKAVRSSRGALTLARQYVELRDRRRAGQKAVDALAEEEAAYKRALMESMTALGVDTVGDTEFLYTVETKDEPSAEDWAALWKHIRKTGDFDLLYRRVNAKAIKERWEQGVTVPGVVKFPVQTLSVTKAKGAA
jgi:hypothetical protein